MILIIVFSTIDIDKGLLEELENRYGKIEAIYPANSLQQGFISYLLRYPEDDAYRVQVLFDYKTSLDIETYKKAWNVLIRLHPSLRTAFRWDEQLLQIVCGKGNLSYQYHDISKEQNKLNKLKNIQQEDRQHPFDLSNPSPFRLHIIKQTNNHYSILFSHHHIILDGYSLSILFNKISYYYEHLQRGLKITEQVDRTYLDAQYYYDKNKDEIKQYWDDEIKLVENINDLGLLFDKKIPIKEVSIIKESAVVSLNIIEEDFNLLKNLAVNMRLTLNTLIQFAWHKLLHIYTNDKQTIVGTTVTGRNIPIANIENSIGLHINTLPLVVDWDENNPIGEQLYKIQNKILQVNSYSSVNLASLQKQGDRLFHSLLIFENYSMLTKDDSATLNSIPVSDIQKTDYPFTLVVYEGENRLRIDFRYDNTLLNKERAQCYLNQMNLILQSLSADIEKPHNSISVITKKEHHKIIYNWNSTEKDYPQDKTVTQLFEEQVVKTPDNIALVFEDKSLTYKELDERSNQLAKYIRNIYKQTTKKDLLPSTLIPICVDRSFEMIIGILAIIKAGGAYITVNPSYPEDRIKYLLTDTNSKILLSQSWISDKLDVNIPVINLDDNVYKQEAIGELPRYSDAYDLVYVKYTSGTTGNPKGVLIRHNSLVNFVINEIKLLNTNATDRILQFGSFSFDVFELELYATLCSGAALYLLTVEIRNSVEQLIEYIDNNKITQVSFTPSFLNLLPLSSLTSVKTLLSVGERLNKDLLAKWFNKIPTIINGYGPTEITIGSMFYKYKTKTQPNIIGKPLNNYKVYILNEDLHLCPIGIPGIMYISGIGLASGYLNNEELTSKKFISNPFYKKYNLSDDYQKMYDTGDLGYWNNDGTISFVGREDDQVKINGIRIELAEIESNIKAYGDINNVKVLIIKKANIHYVVAYYAGKQEIDQEQLSSYLTTKLPDYMIPNAYVYMKELPLNSSGKLDIKELPEVNLTNEEDYIAPSTELEKQLCRIWEEVLGLEKVGITDDFFRIGGDSITAIKLVSFINNELQKNIQIADIFDLKTIQKLSIKLGDQKEEFIYKDYLLEEANQQDLYKPFPLNNVQQAYYLGRGSDFELGNIATHVYQECIYKDLDAIKLEHALNTLIKRHLGLRTVFIDNKQQYLEDIPYYKIRINECNSEADLLKIRDELSHKVYDPEIFPLFDICVSKYQAKYILHISVDALILDANSLFIFFEELKIFYNDINYSLPELKINYRDYILKYEQVRDSKLFIEAKNYWEEKLDSYEIGLDLPTLKEASEIKKPIFTRVTKTIRKELWDKILVKTSNYGISPTAFLLGVYGKVLSIWSGQGNLTINLTLFNRLPLHKQINDILGDFTVLELFDYNNKEDLVIRDIFAKYHKKLFFDIEHNLFDGIDLQRLIRRKKSLSNTEIIAPVVLTSILDGMGDNNNVDFGFALNDSYEGINYAITQTPQVWIDNKAYNNKDGLVAEWDYIEELLSRDLIENMHRAYCNLIEQLAILDWDKQNFPFVKLTEADNKVITTANSFYTPHN